MGVRQQKSETAEGGTAEGETAEGETAESEAWGAVARHLGVVAWLPHL